MTTAFYVTVTMVLGVATLQISYCMAARAIWQILALRAYGPRAMTSRSANICHMALATIQ